MTTNIPNTPNTPDLPVNPDISVDDEAWAEMAISNIVRLSRERRAAAPILDDDGDDDDGDVLVPVDDGDDDDLWGREAQKRLTARRNGELTEELTPEQLAFQYDFQSWLMSNVETLSPEEAAFQQEYFRWLKIHFPGHQGKERREAYFEAAWDFIESHGWGGRCCPSSSGFVQSTDFVGGLEWID